MKQLIIFFCIILLLGSCKTAKTYSLILQFNFDSTQTRLDNFGNPSTIAVGNAGQSPVFKMLGVHYIELSPDKNTLPGKGLVLYKTPEDSTHGALAIDFDQETMIDPTGNSIQIASNLLKEGKYEYIRISLGYQRYDINGHFNIDTLGVKQDLDVVVHLSSFVGFNSYLTQHQVEDSTVVLNSLLPQGSWLAEFKTALLGKEMRKLYMGKAPVTTVVNPLFATSPIPAGSCLVTAGFEGGSLIIPKTLEKDIQVQIGISINQSFEWKDSNKNNKWDIYPNAEQVVDMGIRGMKAKIIN